MSAVGILIQLIDFYQLLIIAYVIMSWFRPSGFFADVYRTLGSIVEPWLGLFRRFIPPLGMIDVSPIVAIIVLSLIQRGLQTFALRLG
ncbi:MAG: YggT family protein [Coriobacteriia bacterium]|nr:YggT family protein [Coriobacteriia bacterium]